MTMSSRIITGFLRPLNAGFHFYERRFYSTGGNNSLLSIFRKLYPFETSGKPPSDNAPRIIMLPEKELQALCDRNFERQLKEIAEKARKTAASTSKGPATDE